MSGAVTNAGFDYGTLTPAVAKEAREVAERVRAAHSRTIGAIVEMGTELLAIKAKIGHGGFGSWLEAEFGGVARTAQNYMLAAESFAGKSEMVSHLPATAVYALSSPSTPDEVRAEVLGRMEAGERLDAPEVVEIVRRAKSDLRRERDEAQRLRRGRGGKAVSEATIQRRAREAQKAEEEAAQRKAERTRAAETMARLLGRLGADRDEFFTALRAFDAYGYIEGAINAAAHGIEKADAVVHLEALWAQASPKVREQFRQIVSSPKAS